MRKLFVFLLVIMCNLNHTFAQVGIGIQSPHPSSILHLNSTNKGLLIPNVSLQNSSDTSTITSAENSLLVFNTSSLNGLTPGFYYWHSGQWNRLSTGSTGSGSGVDWSLGGNTISSSDYLGTNNYQNLVLKVNNTQIGKFVPNGGISLGNGANANENQSVAIGTNANSSASNQATAIGYNSTASGYQSTAVGYGAISSHNSAMGLGYNSNASGYQSTALGYNSKSSNNSTMAVGNESTASGENSISLGVSANSSGQNSAAIGYQATTSQANAIVLGNSSNNNNKVGIGTNSPDERLHVAGKVKIADGSQANGYVLTSNANGVATWKSPDDANNVAYAQAHKSSNENLSSSNGITFGTPGEVHNLNVDSNYIQTQTKTGIYKITYTVSVRKNSGSAISPEFYLTLGGSEIAGTRTFATVSNGESVTVTATKLVSITSQYQLIRIMSNMTDNNTSVLAGGTNLIVEFVR
ncbi:hypothetical protein [Moheibacter sediminis]|uniref:Head domain of trimeric autotransporter adhesin n=1 Tax=Moheibacter sediminis TaxID=1434700 RepID=A0A1W2AEN2_9FLAO|nr:hypothetical protein [Moheibacter sediminis]SMC58942.1 Head domain of trimeric autotransporter adhesin [Moheibacter sediminis]